jgi:hypothetical protein
LRACIHRDECACVVSVSDVLCNSQKKVIIPCYEIKKVIIPCYEINCAVQSCNEIDLMVHISTLTLWLAALKTLGTFISPLIVIYIFTRTKHYRNEQEYTWFVPMTSVISMRVLTIILLNTILMHGYIFQLNV